MLNCNQVINHSVGNHPGKRFITIHNLTSVNGQNTLPYGNISC